MAVGLADELYRYGPLGRSALARRGGETTAGVDEAGQAARHGALVDADLGMVVSSDYRSISTDAYSKAVICNGLGRYEEARAPPAGWSSATSWDSPGGL